MKPTIQEMRDSVRKIVHSQYKHGYGSTRQRDPLYAKWAMMKRRCLNRNDKSYPNYGGRGITVCEKWLEFMGFYEDMSSTFKKGLSLERIDNEKGYSKENCKWITMSDQAKNKRNVKIFDYKGEGKSIAGWETALGFKEGTIRARMNAYGWDLDKSLSTPISKGGYANTRGTYTAEVKIKGKRHFIGRYKSREIALEAKATFIQGFLNEII